VPELKASYVLPLRRDAAPASAELAGYLRGLAGLVEVLVVDGSPEPVWRAHHHAFGDRVAHLRPDPRLACRNGKVHGVLTGLAAAGHEAVVLADDDVRYDREALARLVGLLEVADLVRPQNYFAPLPWHARLDTARTLLNRVAGGDFPGTLGVRRSLLLDAGGYDGDVLFENLELLRTVRAAGGSVLTPLDLYVRRLPPDTAHFLDQRVRQAYDELARPARLAAALAVLPAAAVPAARRRWWPLLAGAGLAVAAAEAGRRRAGGRAWFPASSSLLAPVWLLERSASSWLAVHARLFRGGAAYAGDRLARAATPERVLRARLAARPAGQVRADPLSRAGPTAAFGPRTRSPASATTPPPAPREPSTAGTRGRRPGGPGSRPARRPGRAGRSPRR
jgi:Glycosyl transferase family 21